MTAPLPLLEREALVLDEIVSPWKSTDPLLVTRNRDCPPLDAARISPTPELLTTNAANDVLPENEATGMVPPFIGFARTSSVAKGNGVLRPILPLLESVNRVIPAAEAVKISLNPCLLIINPACPPAFGCTTTVPFPAFDPKVILFTPPPFTVSPPVPLNAYDGLLVTPPKVIALADVTRPNVFAPLV